MKSFKRAIYKIHNYFEDVKQISCNSSLSTDGQSGIYEVEVNLGTDTGEVVINYESFNIPDRFQVFKEDGTLLADSKFVGDRLDNYESQLIDTHNLSVYSYNNGTFDDTGSTESVTINSSDLADGSVNEPKSGNGKLKFQKNENKNWIVTIRITGVVGTTIWNLSASCPSNTTSTTNSGSTYNPPSNVKVYDLSYHRTLSDYACDALHLGVMTTYYSQGLLEVGTKLYLDSQLLKLAPSGYAFLGKTIYELRNGEIINTYPCYRTGI